MTVVLIEESRSQREIESLEKVLSTIVRSRRRVEKGWRRGKMKRRIITSSGLSWGYCVLGAFAVEGLSSFTTLFALRRFASEAGVAVTAIPHWNDNVAKNKQHVLDTFDRAIVDLTMQIADLKQDAGLDNALFA